MAMFTLQWGHRLSAMETVIQSLVPVRAGWKPFNGATAFRRWKPRTPMALGVLPPSMGPPPFGEKPRTPMALSLGYSRLQWGHRLSAMETFGPCLCLRVSQPSMGPPPFGDGTFVGGSVLFAVHPSMGPPPFGDGNTDYLKSPPRCSMGPPPFGDGNVICSYLPPLLQWGHRLSAMETPPSRLRAPEASPHGPFNGATAFRRSKPVRSAGDQGLR